MDPLETFASQFPQVTYPGGTKLFVNESQPSFFFYLIEGTVQVSRTNEEGAEVILHIFYPGSCISLLSLVEPANNYDFVTLTEVKAHQIPRKEFFIEARQNGEFTLTLLTHAMKGMKGLLYRIQQMSSVSAYERVAGMLMYFARHTVEKNENKPLKIHVTHQQVSEWLGLTRENVTLQLKKIEENGLILRHQREIEIIDLDGLKKISQ
jgi:CRP-like cAMP-binding protein